MRAPGYRGLRDGFRYLDRRGGSILSVDSGGPDRVTSVAGEDLEAFEQRAALLKGLPPLNIEKLYVITADDQLRNGEMVLFIGLRTNCVTTVFGLPSSLYRELSGKSENS